MELWANPPNFEECRTIILKTFEAQQSLLPTKNLGFGICLGVNPSSFMGNNPGGFGGGFSGVSGAHLGIYAKSHSTLDLQGDFSAPPVDQETGEILLPQDSSINGWTRAGERCIASLRAMRAFT